MRPMGTPRQRTGRTPTAHRSAPPEEGEPTVLVLRALGLGDFLTSVPALRAIDRAHPGYRVHLAAPAGHRDLLRLAGLDWSITATQGPTAVPWPHTRPPDLAVNLHGSGPQSIQALQALRPGLLWTHAHPDTPVASGPHWISGMHDVDVWCRLLRHYGVDTGGADLRLPPPLESSRHPGAAIVHPGAAFPARRWPELRFAEISRNLAARGYRVVITGTETERPLASRVARVAGLDPRQVLAGRTSVGELASLIAEASVVVCGDTGVGHLATAYSTPSVLLFGPVSPSLWGPRIDPDRHVCLWKGRFGDPHGEHPDPGLLRITASEVISALDRVLAVDAPRRHAVAVQRPG